MESVLVSNGVSLLVSFDHWTSRENFCGREMGLMITLCPPLTTGAGELVSVPDAG
jgi:hypothetical protein